MDLAKKKSLSKEEDDDDERSCAQCNSTKTPLWRAGPDGPKTLCNACGIKYRKTIIIPAVQSLNKTRKPKRKSHSNPSSSSPSNHAKSRSKSAVQSGSSASKLGKLRKNLAWGLNSSPIRLRRKVNDRYNKQKNTSPLSSSTSTDTATATTSARKGGDVTEIGKSVKIGLMALGEEVELLQRQRSWRVGRKRKMSEEEEEAAALLISLSNCGSVMV